MTARPRKSEKRPWPKSTVIAGLEAAAFKKGYEAALRKVWREFEQFPGSAPARQNMVFGLWRSWCLPRRWPRRGAR